MERLKYNIQFSKWFEYSRKLEDQKELLNMLVNKWYTTSNKAVDLKLLVQMNIVYRR